MSHGKANSHQSQMKRKLHWLKTGGLNHLNRLMVGACGVAPLVTSYYRRARSPVPEGKKFILIKSIGHGFFAEVYHVLAGIMIAEITGRIPVSYWGKLSNNLYYKWLGGYGDTFSLFYEPISPVSFCDLLDPAITVEPGCYEKKGLLCREKAASQRAHDDLFYSNGIRHETADVIVTGHRLSMLSILPRLPEDYKRYGLSPLDIFRQMAREYLRPQPDILQEADNLRKNLLGNESFIAVHIRGTDKWTDTNLDDQVTKYFKSVDQMSEGGNFRILLLTDSSHYSDLFSSRYGKRLVVPSNRKSALKLGLHHDPFNLNPYRLGQEVLRDCIVASKAARFVGSGASNVSTMILHLSNLESSKFVMIGKEDAYFRSIRDRYYSNERPKTAYNLID